MARGTETTIHNGSDGSQSERRIPERCFSLSPDANLNGEQNQLTQHQRDLSHDRKGKEVNQALQVLNFT
jgi:hypothetical protein